MATVECPSFLGPGPVLGFVLTGHLVTRRVAILFAALGLDTPSACNFRLDGREYNMWRRLRFFGTGTC